MDTRRCWAEIDLSAIQHNLAAAHARLGPGTGIMAIVKANAYGHGLPPVVRALRDGVAMFGVANVEEAHAVRAALTFTAALAEAGTQAEVSGPVQGAKEAWVSAPPSAPAAAISAGHSRSSSPGILILGPALPCERPTIVASGYIPAISTLQEAAAYSALGQGHPVRVHLAFDTGMGRMGILENAALETIREMLRLPDLEITGLATHLPVADEDEPYTRDQLARFQALLAALRDCGVAAPAIHSLNSAGILRFSGEPSSLVRAGLMLYGSSPVPEFQAMLRPALAWKTRITLIRDLPAGHGISYGRTFITPAPMRIATLAVGYADGYQRHLGNRMAEVLIHGRRCPVLGRVTMDQIMVDVSHLSEAVVGDEVTLLGSSGAEEILAAELAAKAGTIPWEIFTGLGPRVERLYTHAQ